MLVAQGCQGTTGSDRTEYDQVRDAIDSIAWPGYVGEPSRGGFPASDVNSLSYGVFVELDGDVTAKQLLNDILVELDTSQWSVVGINCEIPSAQIVHVDTRAIAILRASLNLFKISYADVSPEDPDAIATPRPTCP